MANLDRDVTILLHIKGYCKEVLDTLKIIKNNREEYDKSFIIRNSISMDLLQIGELVNGLSADYLEQTKNEINWNQIRGMRNRLAHNYLKINYDIVYDIATKDISVLDTFLSNEIKKLGLFDEGDSIN